MEMNGGRSGRFGTQDRRPVPLTRSRGTNCSEMSPTSDVEIEVFGEAVDQHARFR